MDSANKQTAVVAETTQGTIVSSPAFKVLRDIRVSGAPQRSDTRSPERRADRMAANMVKGLASYSKRIELPWARDAGTDLLWEAALCGAWTSDVIKNASVRKPFTLEEKYEGGATDPYRRLAGCLVNETSIQFRTGEAGQLSFGLMAMNESTATTALGSATYAAPTPGYDPVTPADIVVNSLFGISSPKLMSFQMSIQNNMRDQYKFGSVEPFGQGLGLFDVSGQVEFYFNSLSDYATFATRQTGVAMSLTIGETGGAKDTLEIMNADAWNPDVGDPGATGDHMVTLRFMARYYASDSAAIKLTRNVA